ncbi:MAG: transcription termination/antitermination NusG family protein, partial [Planctomycetota bacterium]
MEDKLKEKLEKKIIRDNMKAKIRNIEVPKEKVKEIRKGEEKIVEKKLLPGYLLVEMDLDNETLLYMKKVGG